MKFLFSKSHLSKATLILSLIVSKVGLAADSAVEPARKKLNFKVMSYNVQNLFDTQDDPNTRDEEFTPTGKQAWTEQVVRDKLVNLGQVILAEKADVVGIVEVENENMVKRLVREGLKNAYPFIYVADTDDGRGIRNAILSKYPIVEAKSHSVKDALDKYPDGRPTMTRQVLEATIQAGNYKHAPQMTFLVNHWPSRAGPTAQRDRLRGQVATFVRDLTLNSLKQNPERVMISMGDFNDENTDASIEEHLGAVFTIADFLKASAGVFFSVGAELERRFGGVNEKTGTYFFGREKRWNALDHIMIAQGEDVKNRKAPNFLYEAGSAEVLKTNFVEGGIYPKGCEMPYNWKPGQPVRKSCKDGASDHRPMTANFRLE